MPSNTTTCQSLKASARTAMPVTMTYRSRKYARSTPPSSKRSARWRARVVAALRLVAGAAFVSTPLTGVGVGVAVGSAVTVRLGVGGDTHADISPISRQATAMYGIQVRISTVKDAPENRMQLLTSCRLRLLGALVVSAPVSSRASRVIGSASGSGSPRTASKHSMLPPTWLSYRSSSVATHQALSAGHQMFGGPGQK